MLKVIDGYKWIVLGTLLSAAQVAADINGGITGSVLGTEERQVSGATVQLKSPSGRTLETTQTSDTGQFTIFPVVPGDYSISIQAPGYSEESIKVHVSSGASAVGQINLTQKPEEKKEEKEGSSKEMVLEVKAKKHLIQNSASVSRTEVSQEQIRALPQGSEISLPKLITSTSPGVVPGPFGQMFFRGNHANIQYQIDGVQLPESPSNTFGQAFSPRNIDQMEVITGGMAAEYGLRLSSVVNISTKTGPETPGGEVELNYGSYNTVSPHLIYGGSNESGSLKYYLSANYFGTDRGLDTPNPESTAKQEVGATESVHNWANGNSEFARVDFQADNQNRFSVLGFYSDIKYEIPNYPSSFSLSDPFFNQKGYVDAFGNSKGAGETTYTYTPSTTDDSSLERNAFTQVVWKHTFANRSFLQLAPYYKYSQVVVKNDPDNDLFTSSTGQSPINGAEPTSFAQNRHVNNLGFKGDYSFRPSESHFVKSGFQMQASRSDGFYTIQRERNGQTYGDDKPSSGYFESVYLQDDYTIVKPLILNAGLRLDATQFEFSGVTSNDSLVQPRIGLNYLITDTTKFHIYYGKQFQPAPVENLRSTFNSLNPTPAAYDIKAEKDDFYEAGVAQEVGNHVVQLNVYYKDAENMLDDAQLLNTPLSQPYNYSHGFAYGVEVSVKGQITHDWSDYVNYSYSIAKGKGLSGGAWASESPASGSYQFLDHVQEHTANAGLTYSKNNFWWTAQGMFGNGLRTGAEKELPLPSHFTMDSTIGYEFQGASWWSKFRLSGDVLNILDNRYPITIANGFNGSHYAAGRTFFIRLAKAL